MDDPSFNIDYHVRHTALPAPGSEEQLRRLAARIFSQRLDRTKPLWELWLVEGLEGGGFALINKTHHCLVDGVSGVDITARPLRPRTRAGRRRPVRRTGGPRAPSPRPHPWSPRGCGTWRGRRSGWPRAPWARSAAPAHTAAVAREAAEGSRRGRLGHHQQPAEHPAQRRRSGPHRRILWVRTSLDDLKAIKNGLGGTVNDVFLAVVSGALQRWLRGRGVRTEGVELRGCVPV